MAKKFQLDKGNDEEYLIVGIASHNKDFKLAYHLNKVLFLDLKKFADLEARFAGHGDNNFFSLYTFEEPENNLCFYLVSNKNPEYTLIPELKNADYFLLIKGSLPHESLDRFLKGIKGIPNVLTCFMTGDTAKKKMVQLFIEIELHFINILQMQKERKFRT